MTLVVRAKVLNVSYVLIYAVSMVPVSQYVRPKQTNSENLIERRRNKNNAILNENMLITLL